MSICVLIDLIPVGLFMRSWDNMSVLLALGWPQLPCVGLGNDTGMKCF